MADQGTTLAAETVKDFGKNPGAMVSRWRAEINAYEQTFKPWLERAGVVTQRYLDERGANVNSTAPIERKMNMLWSNVQTLQPALYLRSPKPEVSRRYQDSDPIGRAAAEILERAVTFNKDDAAFDQVMRQCRDDYLLTARGQAWVRYCPVYTDKTPRLDVLDRMPGQGEEIQIGADTATGPTYYDPDGNPVDAAKVMGDKSTGFYVEGETYKAIAYETAPVDYVHWSQFGHTLAPRWDKVRAVWRWEYMTREQLVERFGKELGSKIPLNTKVDNVSDSDVLNHGDVFKRAKVYEVWNKTDRKVIWLCLDYADSPLDLRDDPLGLKDFFPCPEPIYATLSTGSLVPVPDYCEYQDQAREIDELTNRISVLVTAIKVRGVYNSELTELQELLDGGENKMMAVKNWATLAQSGGLKGSTDFLPLAEIVQALAELYQARQMVKQDMYEVTGLSDILRGQSNASETATAQRIKGNFATLRLEDRQNAMARFARDTLRITAEVIAEHFSPQTLMEMTGYQFSTGSNPELFMQAVQLLKDDKLRTFRLDVSTDSIVSPDREAQKSSRVEFLTAIGGFLEKAVMAGQQAPALVPLMGEAVMFGVRGFGAGREMESAFESAMKQLQSGQGVNPAANQNGAAEQQAMQAQMQADQQAAQMRAQEEGAKVQARMAVLQAEAQRDAARLNAEAAQFEREREAGQAEHMNRLRELAAQSALTDQKAQAEAMKTQNSIAMTEAQSEAKARDGLLTRVGRFFGGGRAA